MLPTLLFALGSALAFAFGSPLTGAALLYLAWQAWGDDDEAPTKEDAR